MTARKRAQAHLSEARFRRLFESSRDAIMTVEPPSWKFTSGNPAAVTMFRAKTEQEFISCGPWELSPDRQPDGRASPEKAKEMIETALREGSHVFEWTHRRIGGEEFPADVLLTRVEEEGNVFLQATVRDITERKRVEVEITRLAVVAEVMAEGVCLIRVGDAAILHANRTFETMFGYAPRELRDQPVSRLNAPGVKGADEIATEIIAVLRERGVWAGEVHNRKKDGTTFWSHATVSSFADPEHGDIWVAVHMDITERKRVEAELRESERRFRQLANSLPQLVWTCQPDGFCDFLSQQWVAFTGIPEASQLGVGWLEQLHPDDRAPTLAAWEAAVASGAECRAEFRIRRHDGEYRWFDARAVRLCDSEGRPVKWFGSNTDVTEHKWAEAALREMSVRLRNAREEEQTRIARHIHDDLGQILTALTMDLYSIARRIETLGANADTGAICDKVVAATAHVDEALTTLRHIATGLRPSTLDTLGLVATLRHEALLFQERSGVVVQFALPAEKPPMAPEIATAFFRIFQEALTNVARHAGAARVDIALRPENGGLLLEIRDDGKGITLGELSSRLAIGLVGMRERAGALGGKVDIRRGPEGGTTVSVRMPRTVIEGEHV
jgi:PAS domain S-box-containing protein